MNPQMVWKFDGEGNERPIEEQLGRRKMDLDIALMQSAWYEKNPLGKNQIQITIARNQRLKHLEQINKDINKLEKLINQ